MAKGQKTGGRQKGTPNKITALLKDDILQAAEGAHPEGRVAYLTQQAQKNPTAFLTLLGKVLPMTVEGNVGMTVTLESDTAKL
jgi:hypothetical protein